MVLQQNLFGVGENLSRNSTTRTLIWETQVPVIQPKIAILGCLSSFMGLFQHHLPDIGCLLYIVSEQKLGLPEIILAAPVLLFYGVVMARVT
jgi:hypothetical protein